MLPLVVRDRVICLGELGSLSALRSGEERGVGISSTRLDAGGKDDETHHQQTNDKSKESEDGAEDFDDKDLDEEGC